MHGAYADASAAPLFPFGYGLSYRPCRLLRLRAEARGARVGLIAVDWYRNVADSGALNLEGRQMEEHMQGCSSQIQD